MSHKKPFLLCPLPEETISKVYAATKLLREEPENKKIPELALNAVVDITDVSLHYYFIRPMELLNLGFFSKSIVKMGVNTGIGVLKTFGKKLIGSLSKEELIILADIIDDSVIELEESVHQHSSK